MITLKLITPKNVLIVLLGIVILYLLTCNKPKPALPIVKTVTEQKEVVRVDSIASKHFVDSVNELVDGYKNDADKAVAESNQLASINLSLQKDMDALVSAPIPDTCKPFRDAVARLNAKLTKVQQDEANACKSALNSKDKIIGQKDVLIANGKQDYAKLRQSLDTCFKQQATLTNALKQYKPKASIYIGASMIGNPTDYLKGYGLNLGLTNKRGTMYEVGAIQMGSTINYTVSFKKILFRF